MKICKVVVVIALVVALFFALSTTVYLLPGRVVGVEYDNDIVIIEDRFGEVWVFSGMEDEVICGDPIAMLMWTKLTPEYKDDIVLRIG